MRFWDVDLMAAKFKFDPHLEIAHVLFIDVVGYSKLLVNEQREVVEQLNRTVRKTPQFRKSEGDGKLIRIPVGDGMALVFFQTPEEPVQCAMEIARALKNHPQIRLRMGVHSGPVDQVKDVNDRSNVAGAGINTAQRVMDCGDAGHILVSKRVADDLAQDRLWQPHLHELGEVELKHGQKVGIVNLYTEELGNPRPPEKFAPLKQKQDASITARDTSSTLRDRRALAVAAILLLAALAIAFGSFLFWKQGKPKTSAPTSVIREKSIAVLPFVNMSADKNDEYLSDGVSEELITALSKIAGLQVKARTSSFAFKGKNEDIQKIGELLHVSHLLEGSVARAGNKLRITAQLIQASDGNHLWSDTYDREMQDIFAVRSEVAQQVAATLKVRLLGEEKERIDKKPTENLEAYNLYRQGRYYADKLSEAGMAKSRPLFEQAIEKDPRFTLAYTGLADNYVIAADAIVPPREAFSKAKEAALKAIEMDDSLAEAHASLGLVHYHYDWDWAAAEKEFKRAISLNPQSAQSYTLYTHYLAGMGRYDEAKKYGARALELDPLSVSNYWFLGWGAIYAGRYDEAIAQFSKAAELDPNNPWTRWFLGRAYLLSGNSSRAIAE